MNKRWMGWMVLCAWCGAAWAAPMVDRVETGSSWVKEASFEAEEGASDGILKVQLGDDPVLLSYFEVPISVWKAFKTSPSKGAFYTAEIRQQYDRQYGKSRQERFDSPIPIQTQVNALCAFNEECEAIVIQGIDKSDESIWVAAYAFTRTKIAAALVRARKRGVRIAVKADAKQAEYIGGKKLLAWLREEGIPVTLIYTAGDYSAMHNKFMIFDMRWVVTGSYNFTTTAQVSNWENLVWLESADMAEQYKAAWDALVSDEVPPPTSSKGKKKTTVSNRCRPR